MTTTNSSPSNGGSWSSGGVPVPPVGVIVGLRSTLRDLELTEVPDDVLTRRGGFHLFVDGGDFSGRIDVERPPAGELPVRRSIRGDDAVGGGCLLLGIREHRKVRLLLGRERLVVLEGVDA